MDGMHRDEIQVVDVDHSNIDDLVYVCSFKRLGDPIHRIGIELKKRWVRETLRDYGSCAKIAYLDGVPCRQILHYPERLDPVVENPREGAVKVQCIFISRPEARRRGAANSILGSLLRDLAQPMRCFGDRPCSFVFAHPFDTGEVFSQREFFEHKGFTRCVSDPSVLYCLVAGNYVPAEPSVPYEPLDKDKGRAILFYSPTCQFSFEFAKRAEAVMRRVDSELPICLINEWE